MSIYVLPMSAHLYCQKAGTVRDVCPDWMVRNARIWLPRHRDDPPPEIYDPGESQLVVEPLALSQQASLFRSRFTKLHKQTQYSETRIDYNIGQLLFLKSVRPMRRSVQCWRRAHKTTGGDVTLLDYSGKGLLCRSASVPPTHAC